MLYIEHSLYSRCVTKRIYYWTKNTSEIQAKAIDTVPRFLLVNSRNTVRRRTKH